MSVKESDKLLLSLLRSRTGFVQGCTGPAGILFAAGQAAVAAGGCPQRIVMEIEGDSATRLFDVVLPATQLKGLTAAAALGALFAREETGWDLPGAFTEPMTALARDLMAHVEIRPIWDRPETVSITVTGQDGDATAVIGDAPHQLMRLTVNGTVQTSDRQAHTAAAPPSFSLRDCWEFAHAIAIEELRFVRDGIEANHALAQFVLHNPNWGVGIGRAYAALSGAGAKSLTAAACEGALSGAPLPIFAVAGKSTSGVAATLPLRALAQEKGLGDEQILRAVTLCLLVTIFTAGQITRPSSMCTCQLCVCPSLAASMVYLLGGSCVQACTAIQNSIPALSGLLCDGARAACAQRLSVGIDVALGAASLALHGVGLPANQGMLGANAEESLAFLASLAVDSADAHHAFYQKLYDKQCNNSAG